jgi:hypothetical protein
VVIVGAGRPVLDEPLSRQDRLSPSEREAGLKPPRG